MGDSGSGSDIDECSGITQPTLLEQLKKILDEYRNDVQIIKELVQNADDAGASEMKILYVGKSVNEDQNFRKNTLTGPAFVFYNDGEFSEEDWTGIKSIYSSVKKDDPLKVGRFGLGFKSVFHMTDKPCIISGENILIINPLEKDSDQVCTTVKLKNLKKSKRLDFNSLMKALDGTFGFSETTVTEGQYSGTLFWFSLRQKPSKLSSDIYHAQQVNGLLEAFIEESCRSLTFLKTLCSVDIFVELEESMLDHPPQKRRRRYTNDLSVLDSLNYGRNKSCYFVKIYNANEEQKKLVDRRKETLQELEKNGMSIPKSPKHWVFDVIIETSRRTSIENCSITKSRWLIVTYLKGKPISSDTKSLLKDKSLKYPPVVSLAAPVSETCEYNNICTHVFCYQPLPQESSSVTGLPVHINAFFALGQNRRHIQWPDIDSDGNVVIPDDNKIKWNMALITEMLPYAYSQLCQEMVDLSKRMENKDFIIKAVYNVVPDLTKLKEVVHWNELAKKVIDLLGDHNIIYTESHNGTWIKPTEAIIMNENEFPLSSRNAQDIVYHLLCKDDANVTKVPENVLNSLNEKYHAQLTFASPRLVKEHLCRHKSYVSLDSNQKIQLMQFILHDKVDDGLEDIELLPLADGEFTSYGKGVVYVEPLDVMELFPDMEHLFLHNTLNDESKERLKKMTVRGKHNARLMNETDVAKLLEKILLGRHVHGQEKIQDKKWIKWIEKIWMHIQDRYLEHIDTFSNLPLFPIIEEEKSKEVDLISLKSFLLHFPYNKAKIKERILIAEAFQFLSVSIVKYIPEWITRSVSDKYLYTEDDILTLLEKVDSKVISTFNAKSTKEHSSLFLSFLSDRLPKISNTSICRNKLQRMKLFIGGIKPDQLTLLAISECKDLYTGCSFPVPFPKNVVLIKSKKEVAFAQNLGGKIISESDLIILIFQELNTSKYSLQDKDQFIEWVMHSDHFNNVNVQSFLKDIAFLRRKDGSLCKPSQLFDPKNPSLVKLFKNCDVFPVSKFNTERLRKLGLKTVDDISKSDIHGLCDDIDKKIETKAEICRIQCGKLLEIMEKLIRKTDEQYLWKKRCILIEGDGDQFSLYSPSEIKSKVFSELIDTEMCLIDCSKFPKLSQKFKWDKPPTHQQVVKHFFNVVECCTDKFHAKYLPKIEAIYRHLSQCREDVKKSLFDQFSVIGNKFVWTGNDFQSPEHVYTEKTDRDIDLNPFLQVIPPYLSDFADFFSSLGCKRSVDAGMYLNTLEEINNVCENEEKPRSDKVLIDMAISILNKVKDDHLDDVKQMTERIIYFPVQNESGSLLMRPASRCTFCDAHWMKNMEFDVDDDIEYVHEKVPESTAEALGVPSLRQQMLSNSDAFEEWGQEEPLTRRLRNILTEDYVDGFSVAKELLQNADDAGARSLKIMYDDRENNDMKTQLLSESMAELQGRAIWIYNDAFFTQDDLKNITKIHGGTKESDCSTIGRFGLGFCAVYNVTDVPMFISGSNLVIFDPHTTYLGSALPGNSPGLRINFQSVKNQKLLKRLRNQFRPFDDVFGCQLTDTDKPFYRGSLFRLPLRNKASDICDSVYTEKKVQQLFDTIMKLSSNMLFFNQSVDRIELYHLNKQDRDASKPVLLFTASKQILDSNIPHSILKVASERKKEDALGTETLNKTEVLSIDVEKVVNKSPLFANENHKTFQCKWLVSWSTGNKSKSLEMSKLEKGALPLGAVAVPLQNDGENYNIMSWDDVPDHFYQQGHFFVFLPLPIEHNLPFHINGQFSVTSDRQFLRTSSEGERNVKMKEWNECLIDDAVTKSLLYLLIQVRNLVDLSKYNYNMLWPTTDISTDASSLLQHFPPSFYQHIVHQRCYDVFEKNGEWFDISKCLFIEPNFRKSSVGDIVFESFNIIILSPDQVVVDIPDKIYEQIFSAGPDLIQKKTISDVSFFISYFLPQFDRFNKENLISERNLLVRYAIDLNNAFINELLTRTECIPSKPYGTLKCPCQLVDEQSYLSKLFNMCDEYFPDEIFSHSNINLQKLGMMHDKLTDDMVIFSAHSVQKIQNECCACSFERCSDLLDYLSDKGIDFHKDIMTDLQHIEFVPVMPKPESWSFKWKSESFDEQSSLETTCAKHKQQGQSSIILGKPVDMYHSKCKALVGSVSLVLHENIQIKNSDFMNHLGIRSECDLQIVLQQLQSMPDTFTCKGNGYVTKFFDDIYAYLNKACKDKSVSILIGQQLKHKKVVYVEGIFTCPDVVAKNVLYLCTPHLYSLQHSPLLKYDELCDCLGIKQTLSTEVFAQTLKNIKESIGDDPLQENEIEIVLNILKCLQNASGYKTLEGIVYGPDEEGILRDCTKMCFDDLNEMEKSETMKYAHPNMSKSLAKTFGVKPKLLYSMDENSEDIEDFYQEEPLITRIKNLIEGYPCDVGVFKELLQNADDAKATELHFLLDYDTHPSKDIFHDKYRKLQGPALCVFNNSAFSNDDLKAITRLGRGNKSEDLFQTGRYGVGFNAVYNLTDVPSFLTWGGDIENKETLCFFDPMADFIPGVKKSKPGKRYKDVASIRKFSNDVLKGFHEDFFKKNRQRGSVFRFPLRGKTLAKNSEITNEPVEVEEMNDLLDNFSKELKHLILFLKHINTLEISIHRRGQHFGKFQIKRIMTEIHCSTYSEIVQAQSDLSKNVSDCPQSMLTAPFQSKVCEMKLHETNFEEKTQVETEYIAVHTLGFKYQNDIPGLLRENIEKRKVGFLPSGAVAIKKEPALALSDECFAYCFLPLPIKTGFPVQVHGYFALDNETRRTLWQSDHKDTCYKTTWNLVLLEQVIAPAYSSLIEYIRKSICIPETCQGRRFQFVGPILENYLAIFPTSESAVDFYWKQLSKFVYKDLVKCYVPFLPILKTYKEFSMIIHRNELFGVLNWTPLRIEGHTFPAYRNDNPDYQNYRNDDSKFQKSKNNFESLDLLERIHLRSVTVFDDIQHSMKEAECEIESLVPAHIIKYVSSFNSQLIDRCQIEVDKLVEQTILGNIFDICQLLKYCFKDKKTFYNHLFDMPLFITNDGVVHTLPRDGHLFVETNRNFCSFFPTAMGRFLDSNVSALVSKNMHSYTSESNGVLVPFTLQRFMDLVNETGVMQTYNSVLPWNLKLPSKEWIKNFWSFFYSTFSKEAGDDNSELRRRVFQHLRKINELPVIPVCAMKSQLNPTFLVSPACIKQLINLDSFTPVPAHEALKQVNIFQLNEQALPNKGVSNEINAISLKYLLMSVLPDFKHPDEVLTCLHLNVDKLRQASLPAEELANILRYFSDTLFNSLLTDRFSLISLKEKLLDLPIFLTYFGDIVSLQGFSVICVAPLNMPQHGLKELAQTSNVLFLKDISLKNLYMELGINEKSLVEVYVKYIIPNYEKMESSDFYEHIKFLARNYSMINEDVLNILKTTPFINVGSKALLVGSLFDPKIELFKRMCDERELVPLTLRDEYTLKLFRKIGLQTTLTIHLLERFSKSIQDESQIEGNHNLLADNSECLLRHLFQMPDRFFLENKFDSIRKIEFVKPLKVGDDLEKIHPQYSTPKFICFEGSVLSSAVLSCWTSSKLLPEVVDRREMGNLLETTLNELGIRSTPKFDELVIHCKHIGTSVSNKGKSFSHDRLHDVMCHIYKCIEGFKQSEEINENEFLQLCDVPIIYHKSLRDIFPPKQTVLYCKDEEEEVPPFITKCPMEFAQYHDLFCLLGCWKEPCYNMYASVLLTLRQHTDESGQLLPKQLVDAIKAFSLMFKYLCQLTSPIPVKEQSVYLLTVNNTLEMANRLIVNDRKYLSKKIMNDATIKCTFLYSFDKLRGVNLSPDKCIESLKYLPENMKPHLLTDKAKRRVILDNIQYVGDEGTANMLNEFIHGCQFVHGYLRLARHTLKYSGQGDSFKQWSDSDEKNIADKVMNIRFKHVTTIKTMLFFQCVEGKDIGKTIAVQNTEEPHIVHLEEKDDVVILYFDTSGPDWYKKVKTEIALYLNGLVNKCFQNEYFVHLMEILDMRDSQSNITNYLDKNSIEEYTCNVEIDENPVYPTPGTFVPRKWHQYLDNDYGIFQHYDYKFIALEIDDPAMDDSDINDDNDDDGENDTNDDDEKETSDLEPTYMFVHIIRKSYVANDFPLLQEYIIDDGSETEITVPAYRLYKFVRKNSTENSDRQVALYNRPSSSEEGTSIDNNDIMKTRKEIREYLNTAWKQTETIRRKLVIRLLRKWHPDKNPDNVHFCTKVFQYIQQCLRRLEKGQCLLEDDVETKSYHHSGSGASYSSSYWQSSWYGRYWRRRKHRRYYDEPDGFPDFQFRTGTFFFSQPDFEPYRWISEARRWFRQASSDQENARRALVNGISCNWVCYMSHQAGEKSMKAAWYGKDANKIHRVKYSHQLTSIASGLDSMIETLARELAGLTGDHTRMRYPDTLGGQDIPSTVYTRDEAESVISKVQQILDRVQRSYID